MMAEADECICSNGLDDSSPEADQALSLAQSSSNSPPAPPESEAADATTTVATSSSTGHLNEDEDGCCSSSSPPAVTPPVLPATAANDDIPACSSGSAWTTNEDLAGTTAFTNNECRPSVGDSASSRSGPTTINEVLDNTAVSRTGPMTTNEEMVNTTSGSRSHTNTKEALGITTTANINSPRTTNEDTPIVGNAAVPASDAGVPGERISEGLSEVVKTAARGVLPVTASLSVRTTTDDATLLSELDGLLNDDEAEGHRHSSRTLVSPLRPNQRQLSPFSEPIAQRTVASAEADGALVSVDLSAIDQTTSGYRAPTCDNGVVTLNGGVHDCDESVTNSVPIGGGGDERSGGATANLDKIARLYQKYSVQCAELERVEKQNSDYRDQLLRVLHEKESLEQKQKDGTNETSAKTLELERKVLEYEYQLKAAKDRMTAQEAHFKKAAADYQARNAATIEQLKKSSERAQREKDEAVIKYAKRESEVLTLQRGKQQMEAELKQAITTRDALQSSLRGQKNEKFSAQQTLEQKADEIDNLQREAEKCRSLSKEADIRVKLANQRAEEAERRRDEVLKEHDSTMKKVAEAKEESQLARADYQKLIGQFQDSQEKQSEKILINKQEQGDQAEIYKAVVEELDQLKRQHKTLMKDNEETVASLESCKNRCETMDRQLNQERAEHKLAVAELERLRETEKLVESVRAEASECRRRADTAVEDRQQAETEAEQCRSQAERMLQLTEQLSVRNSLLEGDKTEGLTKVASLERRLADLETQHSQQSRHCAALEHELGELKACSEAELQSLTTRLTDHIKREQDVASQLEDEKNEGNILKRKHAASLKELRAELTSMRRRLQNYEANSSAHNGSDSGHTATDGAGALSSRASSVTSLEHANQHQQPASAAVVGAARESTEETPSSSSSTTAAGLPEYSQAMIEKIVKLQRQLARRTEKIDFLQEHVKQLDDEFHKKTRIIQMYALRERSGILGPPSSDDLNQMVEADEAVMRRPSAVASGGGGGYLSGLMFGGGGSSSAATAAQHAADLSVEINGKLQAVLEETLCKNMTLQESMDTLSLEIARLSNENRQLKLGLPGTDDS